MTVKNTYWQNIQHYIWLVGGVLCLVFALIFWLLTDTKELVSETKEITDAQVLIQPEKVAATTHLGGLANEVRPLELTTRMVASGNHFAEFRGTKYIQENKKQWIIEFFRASNEDVIKSFLLKQTDRKNLIYFRLSGEAQAEQYVLGYALFKSEHEAKDALAKVDLGLPASIKPKLVKLDQYTSLVNDLGSEELVGSSKLYEVKLKSAPVPIIDESLIPRPKPVVSADSAVTDPAKATTKTTITRKDQQGNVVDVKRSQTAVEPTKPKDSKPVSNDKKPAEHQISDPFN